MVVRRISRLLRYEDLTQPLLLLDDIAGDLGLSEASMFHPCYSLGIISSIRGIVAFYFHIFYIYFVVL